MTLGIYFLYWYYKVNDELKRFEHDPTISPTRSLMAMIFGWIIIVPPFIAMYNTAKHIQGVEERMTIQPELEPALVIVFMLLVSVGNGVYIQEHLNRIWDRGSACERPLRNCRAACRRCHRCRDNRPTEDALVTPTDDERLLKQAEEALTEIKVSTGTLGATRRALGRAPDPIERRSGHEPRGPPGRRRKPRRTEARGCVPAAGEAPAVDRRAPVEGREAEALARRPSRLGGSDNSVTVLASTVRTRHQKEVVHAEAVGHSICDPIG